ncbi:MAG: ATP-binding protein [Candidatus Omnitrophica bacterium]|nr:ATP-binding protein [Candidatus Omnitrophota bacterium]
MNLRPSVQQHLRQRVQAFTEGFRQNLVLIGPPGSGKTFQLQLLSAAPPEQMLVIYTPLYRESCRSFLQRLQVAILQAGLSSPSGPAASGTEPSPSLEQWLNRAAPVFPKTTAAMRPIDALLTRRLYAEAFNRTLDTIPLLIEERGRPCVLILDEFLYLEDLGFHHAFHELGKRVMTWPSTLFILASSSPYRAKRILRERLQLLFGQFELLILETLDPTIAGAWARQELARLPGASAAIPFLIDWLGAYPWYLAVLLKRLKELAALQQRRAKLTEALFLHAAWDVLGAREGIVHQWCLSSTETLSRQRGGARALEALLAIAQGARTTTAIGSAVGRAGLSEALQLLIEYDVAERTGTCWMIANPVMRCWLSTVLLAQRSAARLEDAEIRRRFDEELRRLWQAWSHAHQQPLAEQVAHLFTRFADDTISLDSKTGRLPKFDAVQTHPASPPQHAAYLVANGEGRRWCASIHDRPVDEQAITGFETFCRAQSPKPSRKIVITTAPMDDHAKLLAKAANMWIWQSDDLTILRDLYGQS